MRYRVGTILRHHRRSRGDDDPFERDAITLENKSELNCFLRRVR
jgi:hypothetical protein